MKKTRVIGITCLAVLCVIALCVYVNISQYDNIGEYNEFGLAKAEKQGKFGYIDENKKEIIPVTFDSVGDFESAGMVVVSSDEGTGVYRVDGVCVVPLEYQDIELEDENQNGLVPVSLDGEANFINKDGAILFEATAEGPMSLLKVQSDGKYGYADGNGTVVLPCDYSELEVLNDNGDNALLLVDGERNFMDLSGDLLYDEVKEQDEDGWIQVKLDGNYGYVSGENEALLATEYDSLEKEGRNSAGYIRIAADNRLLLAEDNGDLIYLNTREFEENGLSAVQDLDGLWGYIDREGEVVVLCLYDEVGSFNQYGLSRTKAGNETNFISATGQEQFDQVGEFSSTGIALAGKDTAFFFINDNGIRINEADYDAVRELEATQETEVEGFLTCKGIRYGLTDESGEEIIPAEYDEEAMKELESQYCLWTDLKAGLDSITVHVSLDPTPGLDFPEIIEFNV